MVTGLAAGSQLVIGAFVKERREALGLTQEELGAAIGRNQKYVSRLENNQKELPDPDVIAALALALHCQQEDILRAAGYLERGDGATPEPPHRRLVWAGMAEDFTEEEEAIVQAVVEQIRRNKRHGGA